MEGNQRYHVEIWHEVEKDAIVVSRFLWSVDEINGPITGRIMRDIRKNCSWYYSMLGGTVRALIYTRLHNGYYRNYVGSILVSASSAGDKYAYYSNWWRNNKPFRQHSTINWKYKH